MKQRSNQNERAAFDQIFKAAGDPHRLKIIQLLSEREQNAGELLQSIDIVQSTLSHHMKCLVESGIVNARRNGKWTCYTLNSEVIRSAYDYLGQFLDGTRQTEPVLQRDPESGTGLEAAKVSGKEGAAGVKAEEPDMRTAHGPGRKAEARDQSARDTGRQEDADRNAEAGAQEQNAEPENKDLNVEAPDQGAEPENKDLNVEAPDQGVEAETAGGEDGAASWWELEDDEDEDAGEQAGAWWNPERLSERLDGKKKKKHAGDITSSDKDSASRNQDDTKKKKGKKQKKGKKNGKK